MLKQTCLICHQTVKKVCVKFLAPRKKAALDIMSDLNTVVSSFMKMVIEVACLLSFMMVLNCKVYNAIC